MYRTFYKKLLRFYPRNFRERFGESMEQTFDDLVSDEDNGSLSITLRISIDTGLGIAKEHILHLSRRRSMSAILKNPKMAVVIGGLLFLPGVAMLSLLMLGIEPPLGPLKAYLAPDNGPHVLGSLVVLCAVLVLPAAGVFIAVSASEANALKRALADAFPAAVIGFLLVLPLVILELVYGQASYSGFPFALFAILWLLPAMFALVLMPIARKRGDISAAPFTLALRIAFLAIIAVMWIGLVNDQLPCFLGVPNCD